MTLTRSPDDHARRRDFGSPCPIDERPVRVSLCVNEHRICRHFRGSVTRSATDGNVSCNWPFGADRQPLPAIWSDWDR